MRVAKWGNSLAVRIPKDLAEALGLKEGDEVELKAGSAGVLRLSRDERRERALKKVRELARPLPPDWKFDRDEANSR